MCEPEEASVDQRVTCCHDDEDSKRPSDAPRAGQISELDIAHLELDTIPSHYTAVSSTYSPAGVRSLSLHHNRIAELSSTAIAAFRNLVALDVSNNLLEWLPESIADLRYLRILIAKNNRLQNASGLPKRLTSLVHLEVLNVSGNCFDEFPPQILDLPILKSLYIGGSQLRTLPCRIGDMTTLQVLYLGGNQLRDVPATIGKLKNLSSLVLCDNKLETIPATIANLTCLQSLSLHNNCLRTLPTEIAHLRQLEELSLRSNPLVVRFVRDMIFDPPSLKEFAGRAVKLHGVEYEKPYAIPKTLKLYLDSAHHCVNPKCKGVYFEARVEHVKFVDFCGKYRVPLMQYLCSPTCSLSAARHSGTASSLEPSSASELSAESDDEQQIPAGKMRKILLG